MRNGDTQRPARARHDPKAAVLRKHVRVVARVKDPPRALGLEGHHHSWATTQRAADPQAATRRVAGPRLLSAQRRARLIRDAGGV